MPFVYSDETEWPDDYEPPAPRPDQFVYLPPPDLGGPREPVTFSIAPPESPHGAAIALRSAGRRPQC